MEKGFILIPGAGMSDWIWTKLLPRLKQKAVPIPKRIEINNYENRINCSFDTILEYAEKIIGNSGLEEIILVGHSGDIETTAQLTDYTIIRNHQVKCFTIKN